MTLLTTSSLAAGALFALSLFSPSAFADTAACLDASAKGQRLRADHKFLEARTQLRACAAAACPGVVQADCATWLAEVEKSLPTVVVSAKNGTGADLVDVRVTLDGQPLTSKLDGAAVPLNPGAHAFHFETGDGLKVDREVVVREGQQNQEVAVVLGAPSSAVATTVLPSTAATSPIRTVGWVVGGVGVAGLAVGAVGGIIAVSDKGSAHCVNNLCDPGTSSGIKSAALVSDIGWIAGGVLLAGGAALVLFAPKERETTPPTTAFSLKLAPTFQPGGGGLAAGGTF